MVCKTGAATRAVRLCYFPPNINSSKLMELKKMKLFKNYLFEEWDSKGYKDNPIPVGKYNEDNVQGPVMHIEKALGKRAYGQRTQINVHEMVRDGKLKATQDHLHKHGGGDPVFEKLRHPVLYKSKDGVHHIIDGHHRLAKALEKKTPETTVHIFKEM